MPLPAYGERAGELCGDVLRGVGSGMAQGIAHLCGGNAEVGQCLPRRRFCGEVVQIVKGRRLCVLRPHPLADGAVILHRTCRFGGVQFRCQRRIKTQ